MALPFNPCNCLSIKSSDPRKPITHIPQAHLKTPTPYPEPKLIVTGGSNLSGHVSVSGSKNSALPILAATLCCSGSSKLQNVPDLSDTRAMASILESLGAKVDIFGGEMVVNADCIKSVEPDCSQIGKLRGGFFVIGPLLARFGEAVVGLPGGCDIGARPVDLYIKGLRALGAVVQLRDGKVHAHAANGKGLVGGKIWLDYPSVGATETLMMAASMAEGRTVLSNAAQEPEVIDLACFLTKCGACIEGAGTDTVYINGRDRFHGSEFSIMPDRIEAGTFMLAAAITRSCISISHVVPSHLSCLIDKLSDQISAVPRTAKDDLQGFDIKTHPFPGFPTDLQPPTMALLSTCNGSSVIEESVFDNRMGHVKELQKFGVEIQVFGSTALVFGKKNSNRLVGSHVTATDLRGGMSLVLAALAAEGISEICGISHLYRGYENLEMKLQGLGARIKVSNVQFH
nr:UDP-N-acetylglucosamine 1-carboxyvinyltransferase 2-like isoform X1 [Ipomoea batatas]